MFLAKTSTVDRHSHFLVFRRVGAAEVLLQKKKKFFFLIFINCWSSVVASVVLPQLVQSPLSTFF